MIQRRLDASERAEVVSGAVFVWEERSAASTTLPGNPQPDDAADSGSYAYPLRSLSYSFYSTASPSGIVSGIERWTDGLKWGPSRVRDDFLFYQARDPNKKETLYVSPRYVAKADA